MDIKGVLVVDRDARVLSTLKETLGKAGCTVVVARSAEEALEILEKKTIRVMFIGIELPRMSATRLCREIRKRDSIAVIYAMTGYVALFELSDCREAGFDDYFAKPIRRELILKAARQAFEKLERWIREGSSLERFPLEELMTGESCRQFGDA
jgi:CheY-like chemotaxis protein